MSYVDKLIISEPPLQVLPSLAVILGLNEAMILQQLHYWLINPKAGVEKHGHKWIYNSYGDWEKQFPFWSRNTIIRAIQHLESVDILVSQQYESGKGKHIKFYRIGYQELAIIVDASIPKLGTPPTQIGYPPLPKLGKSYNST